MSEGHIAPSRADHGSMGGKPPVNRYLPVSPEQANTGISVTSDLLCFFLPLRPYPRSRTDSWLYGPGIDGEPLFVGASRKAEGWNLNCVGVTAGLFAAPPGSGNLTNKELTKGHGSYFSQLCRRETRRQTRRTLPTLNATKSDIRSESSTRVTDSRFASHAVVKTVRKRWCARARPAVRLSCLCFGTVGGYENLLSARALVMLNRDWPSSPRSRAV
jgi:hypothetical protein